MDRFQALRARPSETESGDNEVRDASIAEVTLQQRLFLLHPCLLLLIGLSTSSRRNCAATSIKPLSVASDIALCDSNSFAL